LFDDFACVLRSSTGWIVSIKFALDALADIRQNSYMDEREQDRAS
jgi:hypothetical protein